MFCSTEPLAAVLLAVAATLAAAVTPASAAVDPPGPVVTVEHGANGAFTVRVTGKVTTSAQAAPPADDVADRGIAHVHPERRRW